MNKTAKLRTACIFFLFCSLFCITTIHLYGLQIRQHTFFTDLAQKQYLLTLTTYPPRALIFDRNGIPLALNKESVSAFIMPHKLKNKPALIDFLQIHYPTAVTRLEEKKQSYFMYIKRRLTKEEQQCIKDNNIEDIQFLTEPSRFYPNDAAAPVVGITNIDNEGIFGVELMFNTQLAGLPTTTILEKDARSGLFYFSKQITEEGTEGTPVTLTIDSDLQFLVQEELLKTINTYQAKQGGVVVMDPETGEILAMASYPTFDPNNCQSINIAQTKNIPLTECYEFGSGFKAFFALAVLDEKITTPDELINCHNAKTAYVEGRKVNTVHEAGIITFSEVIQESNNIGVAKIAKRCGPVLYDHYKKMGFDEKTTLEFPGEQPGFIMHPRNWSAQSVISLSYGYEVRTTLLRLATAFCLFVNDGHKIEPRLIATKRKKQEGKKIYRTEPINAMRTILQEASQKGTGKYANVKGYLTMGKTSTANLLENGQYNKNKNLYGFVGSVEKGSYKRVIACFLKESPRHNLYAATVAAPLFERIAEKMIVHDKAL